MRSTNKFFRFFVTLMALNFVPLVALGDETRELDNIVNSAAHVEGYDGARELLEQTQRWVGTYCDPVCDELRVSSVKRAISKIARSVRKIEPKPNSDLQRDVDRSLRKILSVSSSGDGVKATQKIKGALLDFAPAAAAAEADGGMDHKRSGKLSLSAVARAKKLALSFRAPKAAKLERADAKTPETTTESKKDDQLVAVEVPATPGEAKRPTSGLLVTATTAGAKPPALEAKAVVVEEAPPTFGADNFEYQETSKSMKLEDAKKTFIDLTVSIKTKDGKARAVISGNYYKDCKTEVQYIQIRRHVNPESESCKSGQGLPTIALELVDVNGKFAECMDRVKKKNNDGCRFKQCGNLNELKATEFAASAEVRWAHFNPSLAENQLQCEAIPGLAPFKTAARIDFEEAAAMKRAQNAHIADLRGKLQNLPCQTPTHFTELNTVIAELTALSAIADADKDKKLKEIKDAEDKLIASKREEILKQVDTVALQPAALTQLKNDLVALKNTTDDQRNEVAKALADVASRLEKAVLGASENPADVESFANHGAEPWIKALELVDAALGRSPKDADLKKKLTEMKRRLGLYKVAAMSEHGLHTNEIYKGTKTELAKLADESERRYRKACQSFGFGRPSEAKREACNEAAQEYNQVSQIVQRAGQMDQHNTLTRFHAMKKMSFPDSSQFGITPYGSFMSGLANPMGMNYPMGGFNPGMGMYGMGSMGMPGMMNSMNPMMNPLMMNPMAMYPMMGGMNGMNSMMMSPMGMNPMMSPMGMNPMMNPMGMNPMGMNPMMSGFSPMAGYGRF